MTQQDKDHLQFIYNRLIHVHGENENFDYMLRFKKIIGNNPITPPNSDNQFQFTEEDLLNIQAATHNYATDRFSDQDQYILMGLVDKDYKFLKGIRGTNYHQNLLSMNNNESILDFLESFKIQSNQHWDSNTVKDLLDSAPEKIEILKEQLPTQEYLTLKDAHQKYRESKDSRIWWDTVNKLIKKYSN